jgi:hypothetical protein
MQEQFIVMNFIPDTLLTSPINLTRGWNLVSLPLVTSTSEPDSFFNGRDGNVWSIYKEIDYEIADTIEQGRGYWVYYDSSKALNFNGQSLDSSSVKIV